MKTKCHLCEYDECKAPGSRKCVDRQVFRATEILKEALGRPRSRLELVGAARSAAAMLKYDDRKAVLALERLNDATAHARDMLECDVGDSLNSAIHAVISERDTLKHRLEDSEHQNAKLIVREKRLESMVNTVSGRAPYLMAYVEHHGPSADHHSEDCPEPGRGCRHCRIDDAVNRLCVELDAEVGL